MVRAENSHGISVPSVLSTVVKTLGAENGVVPQAELAAARAVLSGKVIISIFTHLFFFSVDVRTPSTIVCVLINNFRINEGKVEVKIPL